MICGQVDFLKLIDKCSMLNKLAMTKGREAHNLLSFARPLLLELLHEVRDRPLGCLPGVHPENHLLEMDFLVPTARARL